MSELKLKYTVSEERTTIVPDYYAGDLTVRGQIVDVITGDADKGRHDGVRDRLFSQAEHTVSAAIFDLQKAYEQADRILTIIDPRTSRRA